MSALHHYTGCINVKNNYDWFFFNFGTDIETEGVIVA